MSVALSEVPESTCEARIRAFFEEQLPRRISARADLFNNVRGTLTVMVQGAGGWTIRFGDHRRSDAIVTASSLEADCVAVFGLQAFVALMDGAQETTPPVLIGESRLLSRLGQLCLEPPRGPLGARLHK